MPMGRAWLRHALAAVALAGGLGTGPAVAAGPDEAALRAAVTHAEQRHGEASWQTVAAVRDLARALQSDAARLGETLALVQRLLRLDEAVFGPEHEETAFTLQWLGSLYIALGMFDRALPLLERSLALFTRLDPEDPFIPIVQSRLGQSWRALGQDERAMEATRDALARSRRLWPAGDRRVAIAVNNLAEMLQQTGRYAEALPVYGEAIELAERLQPATDRRHALLLGSALGNLARLHDVLGDAATALPLAERRVAVAAATEPPDPVQLGRAWNDLAHVHAVRGDAAAALDGYRRSAALLESVLGPDHPDVATALANLGATLAEQGQAQEAAPLLTRSLAMRRARLAPDHPDIALGLRELAMLQQRRGDAAGSLPLLREALLIQARAGRREGLWRTQDTLRRAHEALGEPEAAVWWGKQAVDTVQSLREGLQPLGAAAAAAYAEARRPVYVGLADLLIREGRIAEAQQVLQLLKERELYEAVQRGEGRPQAGERPAMTAAEDAQRARLDALMARLQALAAEERTLLQRQRAGELDTAGRARLGQLPAALRALESGLQAELSGLPGLPRRPAAAANAPVSRLVLAVASQAAAVPAARPVGLQYLVGPDRLSIVLTVPGQAPLARQVPVDARTLVDRATRLRLMLAQPEVDAPRLQAELRALHGWLIAPVATELAQAQARTLMVSADDVLRELPFAALHDGRGYLGERLRVAQFNEAARPAAAPARRAAWRVAALGASRAVGGLPALPAVRDELQAVIGQPATTGTMWLDERFTRGALGEALRSDFDVLHLASHFVLSPAQPAQSALLLGDGQRLTLADIVRERWSFERFDLVTLSACQTGVSGGAPPDGRSLESLGAVAQSQGAGAVLATLWKVSDGATARFMAAFYRARGRGADKAEAVHAAQQALLRAGDTRYAAPFAWAPFVLMGDWR